MSEEPHQDSDDSPDAVVCMTFLLAAAVCLAISVGFMASCTAREAEARYRHQTEVEKAKIEKGEK